MEGAGQKTAIAAVGKTACVVVLSGRRVEGVVYLFYCDIWLGG